MTVQIPQSLLVLKGSRANEVRCRDLFSVVSVEIGGVLASELPKGEVRMLLRALHGSKREIVVWVRHVNRIGDGQFNARRFGETVRFAVRMVTR